jgi:phosphopantetheinyl transferase
MEGFPKVIESAHLPIDIPIRPYLSDHCFNGRAVLPAVEAMEALALAARRFRPSIGVSCMSGVTFDKFLYIDSAVEHLAAHGDISVDANGDVRAVLITKTKSKNAIMARVKTHAALTFLHEAASIPDLPLDEVSAPEGVCFSIQRDRIYPDLVAFGPSYRNVAKLHMTQQGAVAEIINPMVEDDAAVNSNLLGSTFALDAAFHVACAWGQRFVGIVAFPVGVDQRRIYVPAMRGETCFVHVQPVEAHPTLLVFNLWIYDREGCLHEACSGVRMRDVSGGNMRPPEWVGLAGSPEAANRIGGACKASALIELDALSPFVDKTLSERERLRLAGMSSRRRRSYLAARIACKRISRRISNHDIRTASGDITTVRADRPHIPSCPMTDGRSPYSCSVAHDDRFAVAVAADRRIGVDVEKLSTRLLKLQSLYMSEQEQDLVLGSHLGEIEAAVRIWSIKEAVAKALDISLAVAWQRVQVCAVDALESRFCIDGKDSQSAVHDKVGPHVFTIV